MTTIKLKRGTEAKRGGVTPASGEPLVTTDTKELFIGDGSTPGGIPIGTIKTDGAIAAGQLVCYKDASGKVVEGKDASSITAGLATDTSVNTKLADKLDKTAKAEDSKHADDADTLGNRASSDYLTVDVITQSHQEDDANKLTSAAGVKVLSDSVDSRVKTLDDKAVALDSRVKANEDQVVLNKNHLANLPSKISMGSGAPTGGSSGDLYVQL